ncbi:MAG: hypothetical protein H7Y16_08385 [Candidatus Parcubacteria bacterium]|nr:hypothetical protein [Burkholderiales bacterium]
MSKLSRENQTASPVEDSDLSMIAFGAPAMPLGFSLAAKRSAVQSASSTFELTRAEIHSFLRLIARSLHVRRHYELFQLVQGEVQDFIPHRILISAWGDFDSAGLKIDVVSAIPGVRTKRAATCDVDRLMGALYVRWLAQGRQPLLLHNTLDELLAESSCHCALHEALHGMGTALVHGSHSARDGTDSLYLALNAGPITRSGVSVDRFRLLADLIISQLDTAFRKVAQMKRHGEAEARASRHGALSLREEEIIDWVGKGRTNAEISGILAISEFTVKNHVRRIMKKLGAANRTEAVAKFRCDVTESRARRRSESASQAVDRE